MTERQRQNGAFGAFRKLPFTKRGAKPGLPPGYRLPSRRGGER